MIIIISVSVDTVVIYFLFLHDIFVSNKLKKQKFTILISVKTNLFGQYFGILGSENEFRSVSNYDIKFFSVLCEIAGLWHQTSSF